MEEEKKESEQEDSHKKHNFTEKMRENPWLLSTLVLGILVIILLFTTFSGGLTGNVVSKETAADNLISYLNTVADSPITLVDVKRSGDLYLATISYQDQDIPVYITKDGAYYTLNLVPLTSSSSSDTDAQTTEVPKSDKPSVELYVWSYCPYGVTALAPFADVASLLKNYADFKVYLYYAGHGDFEVQQNKIQACIQKLNYASYWNYAKTFADEIYEKCYGDVDCDLKESTALMKSLGIDSSAVLSCVESEGETLISEDYKSAGEKGVTGSPTLVVNRVKVSVSRTAEAFKGAVCSAFNNVPSQCSQVLSSDSSATSGSC